jgi:hypothetical protein
MKTMILLDHTAFSEKNYVILSEVNRIVTDTLNDVCIVPYDISNNMINLQCAIVNIGELSSFSNGVLIATTVKHAAEIISCKTNALKVLYLWDLDWFFEEFSGEFLRSVFNSNIKIITRSQSHQAAIKSFFKIEADILEDFNLEDLWNLLENTKTK